MKSGNIYGKSDEVKMRKVYDMHDYCYDEYDEDWFENVDMDGAKEFELHYLPTGRKVLKVIYEDGSEVMYEDVHGAWGKPLVME